MFAFLRFLFRITALGTTFCVLFDNVGSSANQMLPSVSAHMGAYAVAIAILLALDLMLFAGNESDEKSYAKYEYSVKTKYWGTKDYSGYSSGESNRTVAVATGWIHLVFLGLGYIAAITASPFVFGLLSVAGIIALMMVCTITY